MKTLRLMIPLVVALSACSSVNLPISPYRIDVQQGNALEQEAVEKLKTGMTTAQVRFLLGSPLLVDPFRKNRWDYVYNFRKGGKLTEKRRLALFFEGDVLARIEAEGFTPQAKGGEQPRTDAAKNGQPTASQVEKARAVPQKAEAPVQAAPAQQPAASPPPAPVAVVQPAAVQPVPANPAISAAAERGLNETSVVQPLAAQPSRAQEPTAKPAPVSARPPEPVALQTETNVAVVVPDAMPAFPEPNAPATTLEEQLLVALNAWANAWRSRDAEAYLAAYAANFQPQGGQTRDEWEKRRRLLLGMAQNIDLKIDGQAFEVVTEDHAQVSFRQFYSSDSYQDAVIKQIKFVRVDNLWLIEEERVLAPIRAQK